MYNNDPKFMNPPEAGLASLLASRGRNGDSVLVHMAPEEVQGLQKLALAHGGSLTINPETGLYEASFLKKLLPTIAGAILNTVAPGIGGTIGKFFGLSGAAASTLGTGLLVGGATALIEGDLKKGLMAGLGAYGGANLAQSLQAAAAAPVAPSAEEVVKAAEATDAAKSIVGAGEGAVMNPSVPADLMGPPDVASGMGGSFTRPSLGGAQFDKAGNLIMSEALSKPTSVSGLPGILEGGKSLLTNPNARGAFMQGLGGGFESPMAQNLSRYATFAGVADAFTPEYEMPSGEEEGASVYIPGAVNPMYGYGGQYSYFLPGQYYKRTKQGLVPYNPYAMAPGVRSAAGGGLMQVLGQQRSIPQPSQPYPYPNQNYPLSTVAQTNYSANSPQGREILSGYDAKIDPFTGEEKFADGGEVGVAPPKGPPLVTLPVEPPVGPPPVILPPDNPFDPARQRYIDMINAPPKPPVDTKAAMDYVADLNRRAKNPEFIAFPPGGIGGGTGGDPNKPPPDKPDPDCQAGYTYDRAAGACVPIGSVTNPPAPPPSPPGPPGTTITPPPGPAKPPAKKDEPKKDEPVKTGEEGDEDKGLLDKLTDYGTQALINMGLSSINPYLGLAYSAYRMFPKKTQNQIKKYFGLRVTDEAGNPIPDLTDEEKASTEEMLQQMYRDAAAAGETTPNKPGSGGVGIPGGTGGSGRPTGGNPAFRAPGSGRVTVVGNDGRTYYQRSDGTYEDEDGNPVDEDGMPIQDTRVGPMYGGGRVRAMQAGGMTAPPMPMPPPNNPYGAAVGEDYNFGFSGGGAMPTEYLAGGKLLEGEGDGMSDDIPAVIRGKGVQRAALADGEFVVPADVVSHLGNGSTKAGAKKLYAMMDRIREARTGRTRQSPAVNANKYLPA